jgi:hypothetical protein
MPSAAGKQAVSRRSKVLKLPAKKIPPTMQAVGGN